MMTPQVKIPAHVAIVMDGNGRWAQARGKDRNYGHANGIESVRACLRAARKAGVEYLTLYAFSTENWGRPAEEVDALMELLCRSISDEVGELLKEGVKVTAIGCRKGLSPKVNSHLDEIERKTAHGDKLTLVLAINYSSRSEIARAARKIARLTTEGNLKPDDITEKNITDNLYTAAIPDPDLIIRTGGEQRLSNFLLWQAAYSELWFTPVMWPDFGEDDFAEAVAGYGRRERRFGLVNEQI